MVTGVNNKEYYENKLNIIIYLLNSNDNEEVQGYLLEEYNKTYIMYEHLMLDRVLKGGGKDETRKACSRVD